MIIGSVSFSVRELKQSKHQNLVRLARFIRLHNIDKMSHGQLARLIRWRLTREDIRWYV